MDGAIYTYLNKSKYVLSTAYGKTKSNTTTDSKYDTVSTPDSSSTDTSSSNVGEMTSENADGVANSAFCNGVTPLFGLPIANGANMTNTHTINLEISKVLTNSVNRISCISLLWAKDICMKQVQRAMQRTSTPIMQSLRHFTKSYPTTP